MSELGHFICKCGHGIRVVGTKWQHMAVIITDSCGGETPPQSEVKYREKCYYCDCSTPVPVGVNYDSEITND